MAKNNEMTPLGYAAAVVMFVVILVALLAVVAYLMPMVVFMLDWIARKGASHARNLF